jgi:hypothetical protein
MKTMNPLLSLLLVLTLLTGGLSAQCSNHPPGVSDVTFGGCNEIASGLQPRYSYFTIPSASQNVVVSAAVVNVPNYPSAPAVFYGTVWFQLSPPSGAAVQFPTTTNPNCLWYNLPDLIWSPIIPVQSGCQAIPLGLVPALVGLQGLPVYTQLAIWDGVQNKWAITRQIAFVIQP